VGRHLYFEGGKDGIKKISASAHLKGRVIGEVEIVLSPRVVGCGLVIYDTVHLFLHPSLLYV